MTKIPVRRVTDRAGLNAWLAVPDAVFAGDPHYIPPLRMNERRRLARRSNPFFRFADVEMFVAFNAHGVPVGRISAQINRRYLEHHGNAVGHFGFFETVDDGDVAAALLQNASQWLAERGVLRMEGPFNFSINEESGLLIDGFESPPAMMMPHARRWQSGYLEADGFSPVMDLYAFRVGTSGVWPAQLEWLAEAALSSSRITVRSLDRRRFDDEIAVMADIFNDAWQHNWGFVPFSAEEIAYMLAPLRPFIRGRYGKFVCVDGQPVGFMLMLPDANSLIERFGGYLLPFNWMSLAHAMVFERFSRARLPLLGLRQAFQGGIQGAQLFAAMLSVHSRDFHPYLEAHKRRRPGSPAWLELSWVLASNKPLVTFLRAHLDAPAKTYRVYGREIAP